MTPENEALLVKRYPHIFQHHGGDPAKTAMAWGIAVGDGWFTIIDVLCSQLCAPLRQQEHELEHLLSRVGKPLYHGSEQIVDEALIAAHRAKVAQALAEVPVAAQVKEKFGQLRFYAHGATPAAAALIRMAEALSGRTCEECGSVQNAQTYGIGWHRTLCPEHADAAYGAEKAQAARAAKAA